MDETSAWQYPRESFDQAMFGLRLGANPQAVITCTPKPIKVIRDLMGTSGTLVTRVSSYENRASLAQSWFSEIVRRYEGTRLGRQELLAQILEDNPSALWHLANIEQNRMTKQPELQRIVVAIDPAVTANEKSDETGIVVCGRDRQSPSHFYVLADLSLKGSPETWGKRAVAGYHTYRADQIIAETNNGGDLVETVVRNVDPNVGFKSVHASRGKYTRAEPISGLYEQNRVHHVGIFAELESQLTDWNPADSSFSPDRVDSLVWGMPELSESSGVLGLIEWLKSCAVGSLRDPAAAPAPALAERAAVAEPESQPPGDPGQQRSCPRCKATCIAMVSGQPRCNQCGTIFQLPWQAPPDIQRITRADVLSGHISAGRLPLPFGRRRC